jgi:hypothetical protein
VSLQELYVETAFAHADIAALAGCFPLLEVRHRNALF